MMTTTRYNQIDCIDLDLSEDRTETALALPLGYADTRPNVDLSITGKQQYEPMTHPGELVWQAEPMAHIINPGSTSSTHYKVHPPHNAVLVAHHAGGRVQEGELLAILADEVQG